MLPLILIGGGGHCLSCIDVVRLENKFEIVGILDISSRVGTSVSDIKIIGTDEDIPRLCGLYRNFLITVGQIKSSDKRVALYEVVKRCGGYLPVIISPKAYVSSSAVIKEGTILLHNSLINANSVIGKNCIINTGALIEHEAVVGDFCHVSTHAVINGQVVIGNNSFIGSNAVIANNISLPDGIIVSAGTRVLKTPERTGTYFGNPEGINFK